VDDEQSQAPEPMEDATGELSVDSVDSIKYPGGERPANVSEASLTAPPVEGYTQEGQIEDGTADETAQAIKSQGGESP
jgi:hypothetical protein